MNFLDVRTAMFSQLVTDTVCTAVLAFLWLQNRKRYAGIFYWVVDFIFQMTAILLIILRGSLPDWMSMGLSNTLVIAGALMGYLGLERFLGKRSSQVHNYILLAVFILVHFYFIYFQPSLEARNLNLSLGLLILCFQCAWLMLRRAVRNLTRMTQGIGWVFALFCLVSLVRIFIILANPNPSNDFFKSGLYDTLALISYQILLIVLAFGLALMVNRRLLVEVKTQEEKFAKAFHSSPYAIMITRLSDGLILDVNHGFEEIAGYLPSEAIGKTTLDLRMWVKETDQKKIVAELTTRGEVQGREFQFRSKSGRVLTGLFFAEILVLENERLILSSISDISERKQAEEAIRNLALFPSENPNPVLRIASDGNLLYANEAAFALMADLKLEMGRPVPEVLNAPTREVFATHTKKAVEIPCGGRIFSIVIAPTPEDEYVNLYGRDETERKQVEEKIAYQASLLANVRDAVTASDDRFILKAWNRAAEDIFGWKEEEVLGRPGQEIFRSEFIGMERAEVVKSVQETGEFRGEVIQYRKDGTPVHVETSTLALRNVSGQITGYVTVSRDITERKQAERVLQALSARQEALLSAIPDIIMEVDADKVYTWANHAGLAFFGEDVIGREAAEYFEGEQDTYEVVKPLFNGSEDVIYVESWQRRKDGAKRLLAWWCRVLKDERGNVTGALSSGRDITERKQAEEAMRESEDKFKYVFDYSSVGKSITLPTGEIHVNKAFCEMLGYTPDELQSKKWQDLTHLDDIDMNLRENDSILSGEKESARFNKRYLHKNGSVVWTDVSTSLRRDPQGEPLYFMTTMVDITERKQAEQALEQRTQELARSNQELEQFAYVASHDLQEPLRMVSSYVQLLERRYKGKLDQDADEFIGFAVDGAERMRRLINDLLAYSRLGRRSQPFASTSCEYMLDQALGNLQVIIQENKADITHDPLPDVLADETQLVQLFQNLIGNAIKFHGKKKPHIHISATLTSSPNISEVSPSGTMLETSEVWLFSVRDNGIGIDPQYAERIFTIFQRLHDRSQYTGTGIGLAICKKIVQRHGGRIWVESNPGKGATFYFTMPKTGGEKA